MQSFLFGDCAYAGDGGGDNDNDNNNVNLNSKCGGDKEEARSMKLLRDIQDEVKGDATTEEEEEDFDMIRGGYFVSCLKQQRATKLFGYLEKGNISKFGV